jgi:hypothetical protein
MAAHPYRNAPERAFWARSVATAPAGAVDPARPLSPRISRTARVVSAGSCFASNIRRYLQKEGFNYLITENMHPMLAATNPAYYERLGFGNFSACYGNVYTAHQLEQLIERAYGRFRPAEDRWRTPDGIVDPFRPRHPFPAQSDAEFDRLQAQHFAAVRRALEEADFFIFTFGLTEAWRSRDDGAVYPVCPGTVAGEFDPARYEFVNFDVDQTFLAVEGFVSRFRAMNREAHIILTVSPVPLVATATDEHVLTATTYSKSVLRVVAQRASERLERVSYFPSYEIITGPHAGGRYFAADRRTVTEEGIAHVMRLFLKHATDGEAGHPPRLEDVQLIESSRLTEVVRKASEAACEEEMIELASR